MNYTLLIIINVNFMMDKWRKKYIKYKFIWKFFC